jgi:uncharacterized RDD family membrane protein YckC
VKLDPMLMSYARWDKRAAAYIVDGIILAVGVPVVLIIASVAGGHDHDGVFPVVAWIYYLVAPLAYMTCFHGTTGRTPGKRLIGLRVADAADGDVIGLRRAFARQATSFVLWTLFAIPGVVDVLWPFLDDRKRALHDLVVRSVVIDERD